MESSLHYAIKEWYSKPGDKFECRINNYIIDIVRDNLLIEIQTKNFSAIKKKLKTLLKGDNEVRLMYPIAELKWIVKMDKDNQKLIYKRKSPKKGTALDLFTELIRIPELIKRDNFSIEILFIEVEEIRCDDGKGSWRRKGVSIKDRKLIEVKESILIKDKKDFLQFIPYNKRHIFSNKRLAKDLNIPVYKARKLTYCLKKMGVIKQNGKRVNEHLFKVCV
ncbi:MAG: hypothetical protein ACOCV8_01035 [Spirochaetota bacterium]